MREPLLAQFKAVHKHTVSLLEAMKYDISLVEADFIKELESISTVLGVLIERVEAGRPREPRYDDVYFEGLARLDADAKGEVPDCPKCHVAHYPNCEQAGAGDDVMDETFCDCPSGFTVTHQKGCALGEVEP